MTSRFATTRWSVIQHAALPEQRRRAALEEIYRTYWGPICHYLGRLGVPQAEVEDAAQDFFVNFFESPALQVADQGRGRFRAFLIGALRHHVLKRARRGSTQKRGSGRATVPLHATDLPEGLLVEDEHTRQFDLEWATTLFGHSLRRLEEEAEPEGKSPLWTRRLVLGLGEASQEEMARELGVTTTALKARIFRLRRRLREILKQEVMLTVTNARDMEEELSYLSRIIGTTWSSS